MTAITAVTASICSPPPSCLPSLSPSLPLLRCSFVAKGGHLYEMDGRKATPVNHGPTTDETFAAVSHAV